MKSTHVIAWCFIGAAAVFGCEAAESSLGTAGAPERYVGHKLDLDSIARVRTVPPTDDATENVPLGQLRAQVLLETAGTVRSIAVTDQHLYFCVTREGIYRLPKHGGAVESFEADEGFSFDSLTIADGDVHWTRSHFDERNIPKVEVRKRSDRGGPMAVVFAGALGITDASNTPTFAADATGVYAVVTEGRVTNPHLHHISPRDGTIRRLLTLEEWWQSWRRDTGRIYRTDRGEFPNQRLVTVLEDGSSTSRPIAVLFSQHVDLQALDDAFLYLTDGLVIWRVAKSDGTVVELFRAAARSSVRQVLVDDLRLYFTVTRSINDPGELRSLAKADGALTVLASGMLFQARQIVQDDQLLYILHDDNRRVSVVAKAPAP